MPPTEMPPPPVPKRQGVLKFDVIRAPADYTSSSPDELSFQEGAIITVLEKRTSGLWKCQSGGKEGLVKVELLAESSAMELPMHEAAKRGNLAMLKELVSTGMSVNTLDAAGNSSLYWAVRGGHLDCVKILMTGKPVLYQQNRLGDTVLHAAAWGGHDSVMELLLSQPGIGEVLSLRNKQNQLPSDLAKTAKTGALLAMANAPVIEDSASGVVEDEQDSD